LVKGVQRFLGKDLGDFIIRRADGTPPFMYCNAIDDALMSVTHALRGDDHVTNTPRQLLIYKALGLKAPQYGHMGLIVGADHTPLSKRNGSRSIQVLREEGFLPIAIVNYLARLGHSYDNNHLMTLNELVSEFRLDHLSSSPSTFDHQQLLHWQKEAVMRLEEKAFWVWAGSIDEIPVEKRSAFFKAIQPNVVFPDEVKHWADILFKENWTFSDTSRTILHETHQAYFEEALSLLSGESIAYPAILDHLKNKLGLKGKALFQPLRVALTNELHGPELAPLVELLGNDVVKERLEKARTC
ncbi:MAG TPA: glutamate--tRNA ligase family protein, partial [Coxiellaceae bacterium]|nr:glutamate--tRNA ligase family protein [Coxiellaceae bacterium]